MSTNKKLLLYDYKTCAALPSVLGICVSYWISGSFSPFFDWKILVSKDSNHFLFNFAFIQ